MKTASKTASKMAGRIGKRMKTKIRGEKKGHTLVELIVSFALTGMLMGAAGIILLQSINRHDQMTARLDMLAVSRIILDKVTGELGGAKNNGHHSTAVVLVSRGSTGCPAVRFTSRENYRAEITRSAEEGHPYLLISYSDLSEEGFFGAWPEGRGVAPEEQWFFDEKLYQGCVIEELDFDRLTRTDGSPTNVIKVTLTVKNKKTGFRHKESRCVSCRQFTADEDLLRIYDERSGGE